MMPATPAVDQHLGQLVLGGAAGGLGGEDRRVALPGQRLADDLGERREDRVLQLRGDQPDQARAALPQPHRALVAEHVERGEDGLAGGRGDARLAVEDAADRRFADPRLGCDVGKPCGHRTGLYRAHVTTAHQAQEFSRNSLPTWRLRACGARARRMAEHAGASRRTGSSTHRPRRC